jgi:hypothetical protein
MAMTEAISCCDNLINFMERKLFITEQKIMQMYGLKEKFEKERHRKSLQILLNEILISSCAPPLICRSTRISW